MEMEKRNKEEGERMEGKKDKNREEIVQKYRKKV